MKNRRFVLSAAVGAALLAAGAVGIHQAQAHHAFAA